MLVPEVKELNSTVPINAPWLLESLDEKFDDAIRLLPDDCVIYGGSVRDLLAGLPIAGDLDIAVPYRRYAELRRYFSESVRWISKQGDIPLLMPSDYKRPSARIISSVSTYTNITGEEIQLIQANKNDNITIMSNQLQYNSGVLDIITNVDLRCSAVMMDVYGNAFEVLPGALEDCESKTLHFNEELNLQEVYKKIIAMRIRKLESRGWKNMIDISRFSDDPQPTEFKTVGEVKKVSLFTHKF
jgi:hypothetical protein